MATIPAIFDHHTGDKGTATAASGAATCHHVGGTVTSEAITTAAGSTYTLTLTNRHVKVDTVVLATVNLGAGTGGTPQVVNTTPAAGSVVIIVKNIHASAAFNAAIQIQYMVL